jgi:hypothetical protein
MAFIRRLVRAGRDRFSLLCPIFLPSAVPMLSKSVQPYIRKLLILSKIDNLKNIDIKGWTSLLRAKDDARANGIPGDDWTFGGTVLMRRHRHRLSKDVDIFVNDPQSLGYLSPRISSTAESLTTDYAEDSNFVKLAFPEGEIDFVAAPPITSEPAKTETLFGRHLLVETSTEIVAKKIWHRGAEITARDIFDFAMVLLRKVTTGIQLRFLDQLLLDGPNGYAASALLPTNPDVNFRQTALQQSHFGGKLE